ncbi:hypothetical protein ACFXP3_15320 [Streptomyces sp. NPDC059096]|uniref:hypothetical protein n=1 Tax=Streptomyces sp. NPDC059096 TaxID=3346727 RepID=UPI0036791D66
MLHRGVTFAHAVILAFSALFSFLFLKSFEDQWALGHDAVVQVGESRDTSTSRALRALADSGCAVVIATHDPVVRDLCDTVLDVGTATAPTPVKEISAP